jgi:hypothetical protein
MEKNDLNRFRQIHELTLILLAFLVCLIFPGCSVLSPDSRSGYVPSYVNEKMEAPVLRAGDSWRFVGSDGREWEEKIVEGEGGLQPTQNPKNDFYAFTFSFGEMDLQDFFPLYVGKSWRGSPMLYTVEGAPLTYFLGLKVIDYAQLKVKAGTFPCYVIEFTVTYSLERGTGYYYYCPQTKSLIKFETQSRFLHQWENYELSSYQVK